MRIAENVRPQSPLVTVLRIRTVGFAPSQLSEALGMANIQAVPHSTVWSLPQVNEGGVVSITVTVWLQVERLVHWSVASQVRVAEKVRPHKPLVTVLTIRNA